MLSPIRDRLSQENQVEYDTLTSRCREELDEIRLSIIAEGGTPVDCGRCLMQRTAVLTDDALVCKLCGVSDPLVECVRCHRRSPQSYNILWEGGREPWLYMCVICDIGEAETNRGYAEARLRALEQRMKEFGENA